MKTTFPKLTTLRKGFTDASGNFVSTGSVMGRDDKLPQDLNTPVKLSLRKLKFIDGDYDQGGVYWGNYGVPIYRAVSSDGTVEIFTHAKNHTEAKRIVRISVPKAKFFN